MWLKSVEYTEFEGAPNGWFLHGLTLRDVNLLVGKNASGKSRILNIIHHLALGFVGKYNFFNCHFVLVFINDDKKTESKYELHICDKKIISESYTVDGVPKLTRNVGEEDTIYHEKEGRDFEFQSPENQLAVVARRDMIQHGFLEPLHQWAEFFYHYAFGTSLGKDRLGLFVKNGMEKSEIGGRGVPTDHRDS